jgi:MYXO-CTERM domain-containing protein
MNVIVSGAVVSMLLSASTAQASGIECLGETGRIVGTRAAVVFIDVGGERLAVSDDPEHIGEQAEGLPADAPSIVDPDEVCAAGWVLPAPHPGDPLPGPVPTLGAPKPRPAAAVGNRPIAGSLALETAALTEGENGTPTDTEGDAASAETDKPEEASPGVRFIAAAEEPTPTPAMPTARPATNAARSASCRAAGAGDAHGLLGVMLIGLALLRRKRPVGR